MKFPHKFIKSEHGRSMVEMLGVLAIIGMLSLGSVWLYDYASKFYEANHIQDSLGKAKNLADVNQSPTHIREVERLLRQTVGQYNPQIQQTEIRNPDTDGQKMTYTVTLQEIDERVCQLIMNKKDVLSSVNITIMSPASADECDSGMDMAFAFDTIRTDIVCQNDSDCAGTHNPFCKNGQCKACEPSDCHGTEPICNKYSGACEPCREDSQCNPNKCATNGSCGECSANEHCTDEFRPICDTYEGVCNACATDGECEPKYCAGNGTCGDCSAHPHCPNTKPKCDSELGVCEACPSGTYWHTSLQKCTECTQNTHCTNDLMPICNTGTGVCEPCSNNAQCSPDYCAGNGSCGDCSAHEHCPTETPKCDSELGVCEACPSSAPVWNASQGKCITCATSNSATPVWNATQKKCISCYASNSTKPYWNGSACVACPSGTPIWNNAKQQCVKCTQNSHCSGTTPICNTSTNTCEKCSSNSQCVNMDQTKPFCKSTGACACPDTSTYSSSWGACVLEVYTPESAWGSKSKSGQLYDTTPDRLGTYEAPYHVYWSGYADDYIVLATGVVWQQTNICSVPTNHTIIAKKDCWGCTNVYLGVVPAGVRGNLYIDSYQGYIRSTQNPHATLVYRP